MCSYRRAKLSITSCVLLAAMVGLCAEETADAATYQEGEFIEITGTVMDPAGEPIPDVKVIFRAARKSFAVTKMERATRDEVRQVASTDSQGQFSFRWRWVEYYNRFELMTGMPRRAAAGESFEVLAKLDLAKRIDQGSPVVVSLVIEDEKFVESLRAFLDSVDSEDERRIYDEMGNPDRVDTQEFQTHSEISWWYFKAGKTYRFKEGELIQIVDFEPVSPFDP